MNITHIDGLSGREEFLALQSVRQQLQERYFDALESNGVEFLDYDPETNMSEVKQKFLHKTDSEMIDYLENN